MEDIAVRGVADVEEAVGIVPRWVEHVELGDGRGARAAAELRPPEVGDVVHGGADLLGRHVPGQTCRQAGAGAFKRRHGDGN